MSIKINTQFGANIVSQALNEKTEMIFGANGVIEGMAVKEDSSAQTKTLIIEKGYAIINGAIIYNSEPFTMILDETVNSSHAWQIMLEYKHKEQILRFLRVVPESYTLKTNDIKVSQITQERLKNMAVICEKATGNKGSMDIVIPKKLSTIKKLMADMDKIVSTTDLATQDKDGLMSAEDKKKLDGIEEGANKYIHPKTHPASIITQTNSMSFVSDAEKVSWNNKINTFDYIVNGIDTGTISGTDTNDISLVSKSGKYLVYSDGYNWSGCPKPNKYFICDVECCNYNNVTSKVIRAYDTESTAAYIKYKVGNVSTSWITIYDSLTNKHNHGDIYFSQSEFADLTKLDATWKPGVVYDNVFKLPLGLMLQWGDTGNWVNEVKNGKGYYRRKINFHTPFTKTCQVFLRTSPQPGKLETGGNGGYWNFDWPIILDKTLSGFTALICGNEGCYFEHDEGYEGYGIGMGTPWLAIGI